MIRRLPLVPTLVVLLAVGIMIRLGIWQLDRMHEKEAMLARYAQAKTMSSQVAWPGDAAARETALYRHATLACARILALNSKSGRNDRGGAGWVHVIRCGLPGGGEANVAIGWSSEPSAVHFADGTITVDAAPGTTPPRHRLASPSEFRGIVAPSGKQGVQLIAAPPVIGLAGNALPDPRDIPNNHFAYAVQWFLFAAVALVIYALAVRKRLAGDAPSR
jgi:surfeit locus 1 family protein